MAKKRINSRLKGANGERELAHYFTMKGFPAERGVQYSGGPDSPDIIVKNLPQYLFEVKRCEKGNLYNWVDQAVRDSQMKKIPVVVHRRSGQPWVCIVGIEDFLQLMNYVKTENI